MPLLRATAGLPELGWLMSLMAFEGYRAMSASATRRLSSVLPSSTIMTSQLSIDWVMTLSTHSLKYRP